MPGPGVVALDLTGCNCQAHTRGFHLATCPAPDLPTPRPEPVASLEDPPLDEADGVEDPPPVYGLVSLTHHGRALTLQDVVPNRGRPDGAHGLGTLTECRLCKAMTFWDATGEHLGTHGVTPELCAEADQHMKDWMGDWKRRREQKRRKRK